jgi:hypothetical protein
MKRRPLLAAGLTLTLAIAASACGSSSKFGDPDAGGTGGEDGGTFNPGDAQVRDPIGSLSGRVLAPEGTIPISNALVYLVAAPPAPFPDGVFCDKCVVLDKSVPSTFSKADGTFELPAYDEGMQYLVVQKGQFRRSRPIVVGKGKQTVPDGMTKLPPRKNLAVPGGGTDEIPKMAVVTGQWDKIEVSLAKLGLGAIKPGFLGVPEVDRSTIAFDMIDNPSGFLDNEAALSKYNIVFIPCSFSSGTTCSTSSPAGNPSVKTALQNFVAAGGKLYTTDYSYEFMRQPWPGYVDWVGQTNQLGSACQGGEYDSPAMANDPGLAAWLSAIGISNLQTQANWTTIDKVNPKTGKDKDGNTVTVSPKVWVTSLNTPSGAKPATVSFEAGCGRVLFSTYHTEAMNNGLLPQEQALLYVLLEVAVCTTQEAPR